MKIRIHLFFYVCFNISMQEIAFENKKNEANTRGLVGKRRKEK